MADQRMKSVMEDDDSGDGGDEVVGQWDGVEFDNFDELELDLSIGRGRIESEPGRDSPLRARPWWANLGSFGNTKGWEDEMEVVPSVVEMGDGVSHENHILEIERANGGRDRDLQYKRAKVFTTLEVASSSGADCIANLPATLPQCPPAFSENNMTFFLCLFSSDESVKHKENEMLSAKSSEDVEIRMDLSDDLLHLIFSFLSQKDLCRAGVTCKQWLAASTHADFWRILKFENTGISGPNFTTVCRRYPNATEVNMFGVPDSDVLVMEALSSLRRLQTLILGKGQFGDVFFQALNDCHDLTNLRISDASLGNGGIQEVTIYHDRLQNLYITKCRTLRISVRCAQLHVLSLKRTSMGQAVLNCPQLHQLDLSSCHKMSDNAIKSAATTCPLLGTLNISSCSCVSDETIREISSSCPNLSVLDASYCPNISLEGVILRMLVDLKLQSCEGINAASMSAIANSRLIEALQLDNCSLLTSIWLDLPHLQNLSLVHLRKFVDLNLRSPMLQYIKVSRCSALQRISITSHALQKLVLQKQESLATLSLQCYNLHEVDLSDCESLTNSVCEVFSDGGGCPMLRSLVLDNCECLTMVCIKSSSLVNLSLIGCRAMTSLELSCPNLQKVNLDGCDHLEKASFCPVGIESLNLGICPKLNVLFIEAPKMSKLELKGCGVLSEACISCPYLTSLDASFCRELLDESLLASAAACPRIESLILSSCLSIGVPGLSSLQCLRQLSLLDLSYTFLMDLQPVFDTCTQLLILKLSACKYLTNSSLDPLYKVGALPALRELDLSYSSIGQSAISELFSYCTNLIHVNLNGCANMHELVWSSNECNSSEMMVERSNSILSCNENEGLRKSECLLENLNCTGCPNIKRVVIPSVAHCFHLSRINLNLSANLKEVDLACANLGTLNLSYCCSLEILKLDCPKLNNLQLLACTMLEEEELATAISHCSMLEILNIDSCPKLYDEDHGKIRAICPSLKRIHCSL